MIARAIGRRSSRRGALTLTKVLGGPQALAFLPALTLGCYWIGGEIALIACALTVPFLLAAAGALSKRGATGQSGTDAAAELSGRSQLVATLNDSFEDCKDTSRCLLCFVVEIHDLKRLEERYGRTAGDRVLAQTAERIAGALRDYDIIAQVDPATFGVAVGPLRKCDLELAIQMAGRLQAAVERPVNVNASSVYVASSIGFCMSSRAPSDTGASLLDAAMVAMIEARRNGPSAIRAFTTEMRARIEARHTLIEEVATALERGDIHPWFQPQVSTETGRVTGFEALARWRHKDRGLVSPAEFLPAIEQAGLMERLGERMLSQSLAAIKAWDETGIHVPTVGVNFSSDELCNPKLIDKVRWELDNLDIAPERLSVEVLESVIAQSDDDVITRNIAGLAELGCLIDLDDFGTGHASISSIRRFSVSRLKIDRSFVMKVDEDPDQQRMIGAILTMAERLELATLAEGVESQGEHALLAQLGCDDVQGYGVARPMPFEDTVPWMTAHNQKTAHSRPALSTQGKPRDNQRLP